MCDAGDDSTCASLNETPIEQVINLQCTCDLGSIPITFDSTSVSGSIEEGVINCPEGLNVEYQWVTSDLDETGETDINGATGFDFSTTITDFSLIGLNIFLAGTTTKVGFCKQLIETQGVGEDYSFYSLRLGGSSQPYFNSYIDNYLTLRFIQNGRALDRSAVTVKNAAIYTLSDFEGSKTTNILDQTALSSVSNTGEIYIAAEELNADNRYVL